MSDKKKFGRPVCEKCNVPMEHVSTGSLIRTFDCPKCGERKIIKREKEAK